MKILEQEIQEAKNLYYSYKQYFSDYFPDLTRLGLKVVMALLVFVGGRKVIQWFVSFIKKSMDRASVDKGVIQFTGSLLRVVLYILLVFNIATHFGVKESSIAALLGTAGVTVGLALQGGLANIAGGIMLLIFKPFQVGDYIITPQSEGTVQSIDIFYTRLTTTDNRVIVIPNGTISNSDITNTTKQDRRLLVLEFSVSYDADVALIRDILLKEMKHRSDILVKEPMRVVVTRLNPVKLRMNAKCWVETSKYWDVYYDMLERIKTLLQEQNISIG